MPSHELQRPSIREVLSARRSLTATTTSTVEECTDVSISGDATYCITGNVCGGSQGGCPQKDDVAVTACLESVPSYVSRGVCIAPVDAQCVVAASGGWECVFSDQEQSQGSDNSSSSLASSASAATTAFDQQPPSPSPVPEPTTLAPVPVPTPAATTEELDGVALSATGSNVSSTTSTRTEDSHSAIAPNMTLNIAVAVAVCALAVVGIVLVKKKRRRRSLRTRQCDSAMLDSITSSPIM